MILLPDKIPVTQNPESESRDPITVGISLAGQWYAGTGNDKKDVGMKEPRMGDEKPGTLGEGSQSASTDATRSTQ